VRQFAAFSKISFHDKHATVNIATMWRENSFLITIAKEKNKMLFTRILFCMILLSVTGCDDGGSGNVREELSIASFRLGASGAFIDIDGDGVQDLLVGAPGLKDVRGRVVAYKGETSGITSAELWSDEGIAEGDGFGFQVANLGDVNNDGREDFGVSAIRAAGYAPLSGAVYVYSGGNSEPGLLAILKGDVTDDMFGWRIAGGDLNDDGVNDIAVSALYASGSGFQSGLVNIFLGGDVINESPAAVIRVAGTSLETGDVGNDGIEDLLVGNGHGVEVFYGAADFVSRINADDAPDYEVSGQSVGGRGHSGGGFGDAIAWLGDVDGDGAGDFAVGQPRKTDDPDTTDERGSVYIFKGYTGTPADYHENSITMTLAKIVGINNGERFGSSLTPASDVDGRGAADLLIGSEWASGGDSGTVKANGAVYLYSMEDLLASPTVLNSTEAAAKFSADTPFGAFSEGLAKGPVDSFFAGAPNADRYTGAVFVFDAASGTSTRIGGTNE